MSRFRIRRPLIPGVLAALVLAPPLLGQDGGTPDPSEEAPILESVVSESESFVDLPFDELPVRLASLELEELEALHDEVFGQVRILATELSTEIWQRMRLQRAA
ncbi:MAG: hypothetical protein KDA28_05825, partial [Phycisphaerales bacterium]|nr:hypothetical protein [Phycisphaerales bacterium]